MDESEKHLENLVKELKEMSQTKYPSYLPHTNLHGGSSTATSINGGIGALPDFILEDEVQETSKVLGEASDELKAATTELQTLAVTKLPQQENNHEQFESMNLKEAYKALERAQEELEKMRYCSNINNRDWFMVGWIWEKSANFLGKALPLFASIGLSQSFLILWTGVKVHF